MKRIKNQSNNKTMSKKVRQTKQRITTELLVIHPKDLLIIHPKDLLIIQELIRIRNALKPQE